RSYGGINDMQVIESRLIATNEKNKYKFSGITTLNNFEFEPSGVRVHRAWQIGDGKLIPWKDLIQQAPTISLIDCVKEPTSIQWSHTTRTTTLPKSDKSTKQKDEDTVKDADDPHMALYDC
ncbi:unnamed protein product, partial [Didymodactylos carnosus]